MSTKEIYLKRKKMDLIELESEVSRISKAGGSGSKMDNLNHRYVDAQNALQRFETAGDGEWEELMGAVDTAFRSVYQALNRMSP